MGASSTPKLMGNLGAIVHEGCERSEVASDCRPSGHRTLDHRVNAYNVKIDVISLAKSMSKAPQFVDRPISRQDDSAYANYGHRAKFKESDVRVLSARRPAIKGLQAPFEDGFVRLRRTDDAEASLRRGVQIRQVGWCSTLLTQRRACPRRPNRP